MHVYAPNRDHVHAYASRGDHLHALLYALHAPGCLCHIFWGLGGTGYGSSAGGRGFSRVGPGVRGTAVAQAGYSRAGGQEVRGTAVAQAAVATAVRGQGERGTAPCGCGCGHGGGWGYVPRGPGGPPPDFDRGPRGSEWRPRGYREYVYRSGTARSVGGGYRGGGGGGYQGREGIGGGGYGGGQGQGRMRCGTLLVLGRVCGGRRGFGRGVWGVLHRVLRWPGGDDGHVGWGHDGHVGHDDVRL